MLIESKVLTDWLERFSNVDCCLEAIPTDDELLEHPHAVDRGLIKKTEIKYPGLIDNQTTPTLDSFREISIDNKFKWE